MDANVILRSLRNLSEQAIYDLIQKSAKKSRVLDPLPPTLVCDSLDVLLPVINSEVIAPAVTAAVLIIKTLKAAAAALIGAAAAAVELDDQIAEVKKQT